MPARTLKLEALDARDVPALLTGAEVVVGADAGSPGLVRLLDPSTQTVQAQFLPYGTTFFGGVRVAVGDVNGDGYPDLVTAAGPGGGPQVNVYDGRTGGLLSAFMAFGSAFTGGVNVAVGDLAGDGRAEVICGAGAGGGPAVSVFDGTTGTQVAAFMAYDPNFLGGVRVAAGDLYGTGKDELLTAPGYSGGPDVRFYRLGGAAGATQVGGFAGFDPTFTGGVYIAAGDTTGSGRADVIVGAGPGGSPRVAVFTPDGTTRASFMAYDEGFHGGVRVSAADLTGTGAASVLTVAGPGGAAQVNAYAVPATTPVVSLDGFPANQDTGAFVAGASRRLNLASSPTGDVSAAYNAIQQMEQNGRSLVPVPVGVPVYGGLGYPFGLFGLGYGLGGYGGYGYGLGGYGLGGYGYGLGGPGYFDAPGLYSSLGSVYSPSFFGNGYYGAPSYVPAPGNVVPTDPLAGDPGYYNPDGYPIGQNTGDPTGGFSDPTGGFSDPTAGDAYAGNFGGGGFSDFGGGDFGGGDDV